jgi:REP element-mobilizing transposase RayT
MANTYTQIHIQIVFTVQFRDAQISNVWKEELYKYISGIVQNNGHKVLQINGMQDHIHILVGIRPTQSLSDLVKQIKQDSSKWINKKRFTRQKFAWQAGYGAFSYSKNSIPSVINYIQNQEEHHKKKSFMNEYIEMLNEADIKYDEQYIFKPLK